MSDIITTLHPENDENTNLYPNIKKENIPNSSIDRNKLDANVNSLLDSINELHPSGVDTSSTILAFTTNKGIWIGSDTGHWYYWNGTQYADGGVYQVIAVQDGTITRNMLDTILKYNNDMSIKGIKVYDYFKVCGNLIPYGILETLNGKYNYRSGAGKLVIDTNPNYTCYKIDYKPNTNYHISESRFFDIVDADGNVLEEQEYTSNYISQDLTNAKYIYICIHNELQHYISINDVKKLQNNFISSIFTNNDILKKMYSKVNIYPNNVLEIITGQYAYKNASTGKIAFDNNPSYNVCKVPYIDNVYYSCPIDIRFFDIVDENDNVLFEEVSTTGAQAKPYLNAKYIYITLYSDVDILYKNSVNLLKNIYLGTSAKDISISASCKIGTPSLKLCLYTDNDELRNYVEITSTEIIAWSYLFGTPYERRTEHNLTLANNIQVNVFVTNGSYCYITLVSNGEKFEWSTNFDKMGVTHLEVETSSNNTDITYSYNVTYLDKDNWIFGDSYVSLGDPSRWVYYLKQNTNYDNYLIDGHSGENSGSSISSLKGLLKIGKPKNVFWFLGMNDGNDTDINTPSVGWQNGYNELIKLSKEYGFKIIFGTIPTVPSVNNEGKNNVIKNSGYDYIDFAKAVGSNSSGVWYTGMLSSDEVHPSEKGAKALYGQFIVDATQIKIK